MRDSGVAMQKGIEGGARYRLVVRGELDARYACLFEGMEMAPVAGTTVVTGIVRDQAQLHGYIERIEELGLELVEVRQVNDAEALEPESA
jgi:hypothetical protein